MSSKEDHDRLPPRDDVGPMHGPGRTGLGETGQNPGRPPIRRDEKDDITAPAPAPPPAPGSRPPEARG